MRYWEEEEEVGGPGEEEEMLTACGHRRYSETPEDDGVLGFHRWDCALMPHGSSDGALVPVDLSSDSAAFDSPCRCLPTSRGKRKSREMQPMRGRW